jgi:predicted RecA/RadA family phage recombinase
MASGDYVSEGDRINYTTGTATVSAGGVVVVRTGATGMIGVAVNDIAASGTGPAQIEGVFELTKKAGTANVFAVGDVVYWDAAEGNISAQASANAKAGIAWEAAVAGDVLCKVKLIPSKA